MTDELETEINPESSDPEQTEGMLTKRHAFGIATMIMIAFLTVATAFALMGYSIFKYRFTAPGPTETEHVFTVPRGAGMSAIARDLAEKVVGEKKKAKAKSKAKKK